MQTEKYQKLGQAGQFLKRVSTNFTDYSQIAKLSEKCNNPKIIDRIDSQKGILR